MSRKRVKPDELLSNGAITISRFGSTVRFGANWSPDEFRKMQTRFNEAYPSIVASIDALVSEIAQIVSELPPDLLLHRAWGESTASQIGTTTESDLGYEDMISLRMIDYIQSVIAAVPPSSTARTVVSDADWSNLRTKVSALFRTVSLDYHLAASANARSLEPDLNPEFEEFKYRAQMYWCNIRGSRYQIHQPIYLNDMFPPFTTLLQDSFGITADALVAAVTRIWRSLSYGLGDALLELRKFQSDVVAAVDATLGENLAINQTELAERMRQAVIDKGWKARETEIFERCFKLALFDVEALCSLPDRLLKELTWEPGQERDFFAPGPFRGWPLRIWPITKRPFVSIRGRTYCFDMYGLFDNVYRVIQRAVIRSNPALAESWNGIQQQLSEALPFKYLTRLLPGAVEFRSVYYRAARSGGGSEWCEADGLLIYDGYLFVVEVRAGAFTYTPPSTDFPSYVSSLKNLLLKPAAQGRRFVEYLRSAGTVPIFDSAHKQVGTLARGDYRQVTICAVTLDPFTELAAQVQHLKKLGVDVGSAPVWALSIDDLRVYAEVFQNPLVFLHYVEQRMQAFGSDVVQVDDELDHLGLYLKHNHYATYADGLKDHSISRVMFNGYRAEIDKFFSARMTNDTDVYPLQQVVPARLLEILEALVLTGGIGRAEVASFLLDNSGEARAALATAIDDELGSQPETQRARPLSIHGALPLTLFCWTPDSLASAADIALRHTRTVLLLHNEPRRLLLELTYSAQRVLERVLWSWIDVASIPLSELPALRAGAENLRERRIDCALAEGKIGRNDNCPCGSGLKYKRCHLGR